MNYFPITLIILILFFILKTRIIESFALKFIHIPKNAGTSIENIAKKKNIEWGFLEWIKKGYKTGSNIFKIQTPWIYKPNNKEYDIQSNCFPWHQIPDELGREFIDKDDELFCVVRNPYTKIVSAYKYSHKNPTKKGLNEFIKDKLNNFEKNKYWNGCHILPQHLYTHGKIKCNHILKFENLKPEFDSKMKEFNLDLQIEKVDNKSNSKLSMKDLDTESKKLIYKIYKKDFKLFNYKK